MGTSKQGSGLGSRKLSTIAFRKSHKMELSKKNRKALLKQMFHITKLKKSKSNKFDNALKELKAQHGSLRGIAKKLGLTWGEMQGLYRK